MNSAPNVTIGVPVYNGARYLQIALASLLTQDYDSMEIVISDNASTDETENMSREAQATDSRVRYIRHERNKGGVWNVNFLVQEARGDFFKWAYYDDVCGPSFVSACLAALRDAGDMAVMAYTRALTIDSEGEVMEERNDSDLRLDRPLPHERIFNLLYRLANQTEFGLMRTEAVRRTRGVLPYIGSEMYFLTEMALQGSFVLVPEQLLRLRRHAEQFGRDRFSEANWYSESGRPQSLVPFTRMNAILLRTVSAAPLPLEERLRCATAVLQGWTIPRKRSIASDVKNLPRTWRARRRVDGSRPNA